MLTQEQINQFHRDGYLLIPDVLTAEQVGWLRAFFRPKFDLPPDRRFPGDVPHALYDIYRRYPESRWLLFHEPSIRILKSLLGDDYVVLREASAHFNLFGGWHKDTTSQEKLGHLFQWEDDFLMVELAYYLQDNSEDFGGGLDVEPQSHMTPDLFAKRRITLGKVWHKLTGEADDPVKKFISIPSKAGDLLIFHFRINHRATQARQPITTKEREKLALFLACSRNNAHVRAYHEFIHSRPDYLYLKDYSYPPDLVDQAKAAGINLS